MQTKDSVWEDFGSLMFPDCSRYPNTDSNRHYRAAAKKSSMPSANARPPRRGFQLFREIGSGLKFPESGAASEHLLQAALSALWEALSRGGQCLY